MPDAAGVRLVRKYLEEKRNDAFVERSLSSRRENVRTAFEHAFRRAESVALVAWLDKKLWDENIAVLKEEREKLDDLIKDLESAVWRKKSKTRASETEARVEER